MEERVAEGERRLKDERWRVSRKEEVEYEEEEGEKEKEEEKEEDIVVGGVFDGWV